MMNRILKSQKTKTNIVNLQEIFKKLRQQQNKTPIKEEVVEEVVEIKEEVIMTNVMKEDKQDDLKKLDEFLAKEEVEKEAEPKTTEKLKRSKTMEEKKETKVKKPSDGFIEDLELLNEMKEKRDKRRDKTSRKTGTNGNK